jgi:hypothetical protein
MLLLLLRVMLLRWPLVLLVLVLVAAVVQAKAVVPLVRCLAQLPWGSSRAACGSWHWVQQQQQQQQQLAAVCRPNSSSSSSSLVVYHALVQQAFSPRWVAGSCRQWFRSQQQDLGSCWLGR